MSGMDDVSKRLAATGRLLVRSAAEIAGLLRSMASDGDIVTASVGDGKMLFLSRLLHVEPGAIVLACSDEKLANSALLGEQVVTFSCNHRGVHYEFAAGQPCASEHAGAPAVRLAHPVALVALQRRAHARTPVPAGVPLVCEIPLGPLSFEAKVVDISVAGIGGLIYDIGIRIDAGTRIQGAKIRHPKRSPVIVDLEVRHVIRVTLQDGRPAHRAGCRILASRGDLESLIKLFVTEI